MVFLIPKLSTPYNLSKWLHAVPKEILHCVECHFLGLDHTHKNKDGEIKLFSTPKRSSSGCMKETFLCF